MNICDTRLQDPGFAYSLWQTMEEADYENSKARAQIAAMIGGAPPFEDDELVDSYQGDAANFNTREASAILATERSAFHDLISGRALATFETDYKDPVVRRKMNEILAQEYTKLLRSWDSFQYWYGIATDQMVDYGVGFVYWQDETDFRFKSAGWCEFKMPFDTPATEDSIMLLAARIPKDISELMEALEENATMGSDCLWDLDMLRKLVMEESKKALGADDPNLNKWNSWEHVERTVKENPAFFSGAMSNKVFFINFWIIEKDGSVSHALLMDPTSSANGAANQTAWIYFNRGRYENLSQAVVTLTYDSGQGTYHSIRGRGWNIQPQVMSTNILTLRMADGAADSTRKLLQVTNPSNTDYANLALARMGDNEYIPAGLDYVQRTFPDYSRTILPVINYLEEQLRRNNTGARAQPSLLQKAAPEFAQEIEAQSSATLARATLDRFYGQLDKIHREVVRRICDPTYDRKDPGGELVYQFQKRLLKRGAKEALLHITEVKAKRVVGAGSSSSRLLSFQRLWNWSGSFDPLGRRNLVEDLVSEEVGYENAERYLPPALPEEQRAPIDVAIASFENNFFQDQKSSPVLPDQDHFSHIATHLTPLTQMMDAVGERGEDVPLEEQIQVFQILMTALPHCTQHVEFMSYDKSRKSETKQAIQILQQLSAASDRIRNQVTRQVKAQQEAEQAEYERQQQQHMAYVAELEQKAQQGGPDQAALQQKLMEAEIKAKAKQVEFMQKMQHRQMEFDQKLAFRQAEQAAKAINNLPMPATNQFNK
jgi:hypothetical protein